MSIHPSILSADFANLASELQSIATADAAHVDVMDNHFVPNLTMGLPIVARLQEVSPIPLDVHLMIENPDHWAPQYAETGAASITFHLEAAKDSLKLAREIRRLGSQVAIAIKPGTNVQELRGLLTEIDMVLIMTVEPGCGGQKLIPQTISKVAEIRSLISSSNLELVVQVDGGVTEDNIGLLAENGATSFVAGSAVFNFENRALQIERLRQLASH